MTNEANSNVFNELNPGTVLLNGRYTIEKRIGEGGFGITYKAIQSGLNRTVCIKEYFMTGKCSRDTHAKTVYTQTSSQELFEKYRQSFVEEAKMLASLHHPNIVEVIDVFDENNTSYMVMSFIEGETLQHLVGTKGRLPYSEAVNYIAQVTNAIGYIHDRGILHRDIKPDNIMITADYRAILIDFGSAREFEHDKTQFHTSILTHGYAPTEQYTSKSRKGSYTDIYAIGGTLYFALTAQVPLEAAARWTEQMPAPKELVKDIPDEVNRTILKAMQLKAENRHQTVQEFMDDLRNIKPSVLIDETIGGGANDTTITNNNTKPKPASSKRIWPYLVLLIVVGAIVALIFGISSRKVDKVPEEMPVVDSTNIKDSLRREELRQDSLRIADSIAKLKVISSKTKTEEKAKVVAPKTVAPKPEPATPNTPVPVSAPKSSERDTVVATEPASEQNVPETITTPASTPNPVPEPEPEPELDGPTRDPVFQGGDVNNFARWITSELIYPADAMEEGIQGIVYVRFTVNNSGYVTNVMVRQSVHPALDAEAVRVVSSSPQWEPALDKGRPIWVTYNVPVNFTLTYDKKRR